MPNYRRSRVAGGRYFFTVNLLEQYPNDLLIRHIDALRDAVSHVRRQRPFDIHGWVVLPDHIHCIWSLPAGDLNFETRWRLIKTLFVKALPTLERRSIVRVRRGERGIWQRRYWEHTIMDDRDFEAHMNYLHFNPVKHGYVDRVRDWPYSTFLRCVDNGTYPLDWGGDHKDEIDAGERG